MKKFLIILSFILMPVAGFYIFSWWLSNQKVDAYALIPENAFAVICSEDFYSDWDSLQNSNLWKNLQGLPNLSVKEQRMNSLYSLSGGKKNVEAYFKGKKILVSLHLINATDFDYLFFLPIISEEDRQIFLNLTNKIGADTSYKIETRKYEDLDINEITKKSDNISFSYFRYKNLIICSYSGTLIEDVARVISGEDKDNFLIQNQKVKTPPIAGSKTYVYFNYKNISAISSVFSDSSAFYKPLNSFADISSMDIKMGRKEIRLTGFTTADGNDFINVFKGQKPQPFNLKNYVPNNTSSFYYFGFDNGSVLNESLIKFWKQSDSSVLEARRDVYELYNIDFSSVFAELGHEIGLGTLEPEPGKVPGKLLFLKANNPNRFFLHLNKVVTLAKEDRSDTLYSEQYHGYQIREMNLTEFPFMMLGQFFNGFPKSYYVVVGDCIVFSNEPRHLRQLAEDIDLENVWGKTSSINAMLENNFTPSNLSFFIDAEKSWKSIFQQATADVKIQLQNNMEELKQINKTLIQYEFINDKIFTSILINHDLDQEILNIDNSYVSENVIDIDKGVLSSPYLFTFKDRNEVIVQDSSFQLFSISQGLVLWSDTLGKEISGPVLSVDLERKGEQTYFGVAKNIVFAYGRTGARLDGFPIILPDSVTLNCISVIDPDHSNNHRVLVADHKGRVYMFDKKGKAIEGWTPLTLNGTLNHPVKHLRIKGKDVWIALLEGGIICAINSKGQFYKGFPLDLKVNTTNPLFIDGDESSADKSFLILLSDNGEIIKTNLKGEILKREKVSNLSSGTVFKLFLDQTENSYAIVTQSKNELSVLNEKLEPQFEMIVNSVNLDFAYYNSSDKSMFVIFDRDADLCYLMDEKGKNIFKTALKVTKPIKLTFNDGHISIVKVNQYKVEEGLVQ